MNRREFIKEIPIKIGIGAAVISTAPQFITSRLLAAAPISLENESFTQIPADTKAIYKDGKKSTIAVVTDINSVNETWHIQEGRIRGMFEEGLMALTNKSTVKDGWLEIFPNLKSTDVIGLKVNTLNPKLPTHPQVAFTIAESLIQFGVNPNNIIVWDRIDNGIMEGMQNSGYTMNPGSEGVRCIAIDSDGIGFDEKAIVNIPSVGCKFPLTRIISQMCDYLINVPVLKDHGITGVTMCMKNFYGAIPLWNKFALLSIKKMHHNHARTQIVELYNTPFIRDKVRLNVCDALIGCYDGGPSGRPQWTNHQLFLSTDPVAMDQYGLEVVNSKRRENRLPDATFKAGYIQAAADARLGTNIPEMMDIRHVNGA